VLSPVLSSLPVADQRACCATIGQVEGGLLRDEDWRPLDGEICRVRAFTPLAGRVDVTRHARPHRLICPKQAYEVMTDPSFRPELDGMERHRAASPIVRWEPEVME
jgi:hypothetical protein